MSLGALMTQYYPYGVYQPGTPSPDPKICMIQPSLDISDRTYPPPKWYPYEHHFYRWYYLLYYLHILSTFNVSHCISIPMDSHRNIYVVVIDNKLYSLTCSDAQLLCYKQKRARFASLILPLAWGHPYELTFLEEHHALFDQGIPLLEPTICYHEVLSDITN